MYAVIKCLYFTPNVLNINLMNYTHLMLLVLVNIY